MAGRVSRECVARRWPTTVGLRRSTGAALGRSRESRRRRARHAHDHGLCPRCRPHCFAGRAESSRAPGGMCRLAQPLARQDTRRPYLSPEFNAPHLSPSPSVWCASAVHVRRRVGRPAFLLRHVSRGAMGYVQHSHTYDCSRSGSHGRGCRANRHRAHRSRRRSHCLLRSAKRSPAILSSPPCARSTRRYGRSPRRSTTLRHQCSRHRSGGGQSPR